MFKIDKEGQDDRGTGGDQSDEGGHSVRGELSDAGVVGVKQCVSLLSPLYLSFLSCVRLYFSCSRGCTPTSRSPHTTFFHSSLAS